MSERLTDEELATALKDPGFCRMRTDHVGGFAWDAATGWSGPGVGPYAALDLDPTAMVLHYGQAVFEGLKAFRRPDGGAALFRPADHARRLRASAARLAMAEPPADLFTRACAELTSAEDRWIPGEPGQGLYLRPILLATEAELGLRASHHYRCTVLASPADPCYGRDFRPLSVLAVDEDVRAVRGGTGEAKCAGNYAASLRARDRAMAAGFHEVLWLDGVERRWVEELSTMNVFFVWREPDGEALLTTPPCTGAIMRGITRDSLLTLAGDLGLRAEERPTSVDEVVEGVRTGRLTEMLACGTAAVVVPVGDLTVADRRHTVGDGGEGPVTARLRRRLIEHQHGLRPDTHGWLWPVPNVPTGEATTEGRRGSS
ncbi:branched-chain amino acid aminotransferase [Kitasatospora sp. NPDC101183]|uniref:branched-chain amino acid aminotransferase n=1 Tax=Kitasatospora sp. NPDC101183 TaxID=3364100 RepID=UPI0038308FCD